MRIWLMLAAVGDGIYLGGLIVVFILDVRLGLTLMLVGMPVIFVSFLLEGESYEHH